MFLLEDGEGFEENLVKYNNLSGLIRKHCGKQVRDGIQLRLYNVI
jgi:hypothetical protein